MDPNQTTTQNTDKRRSETEDILPSAGLKAGDKPQKYSQEQLDNNTTRFVCYKNGKLQGCISLVYGKKLPVESFSDISAIKRVNKCCEAKKIIVPVEDTD
ncbi:MAG: hypothetical protein ABIH39_08700, partial [Candidatus Margulisiibacteriota bacterium]